MDSYLLKMGRRAGVGMHFTSLPGPHGCGDIADAAISFIDLLERLGARVWQFLPTGPTTAGYSPYQPMSVFAGNPLLIGLDPLVRLGLLKSSEATALTRLPQAYVDYDRVMPIRNALLSEAWLRFRSRRFAELQMGYEAFLHRHDSAWLHDYALFRTLKTLHGEQDWLRWERRYRQRQPTALSAVAARHHETIGRIKFIQFLFEEQCRELKRYAQEKDILLFGDMPIYVALDSADAWAQPELLQLDAGGRPSHVAGVPPDYFSADGQLWNNPLYDWDYHRQTGFQWWIERLGHASRQMSLVRMDHFRGFESYWSVPAGSETARSGNWEPGPGDALFDSLSHALGDLPIVAEDLGVITPQVTALRFRFGIPGMRVLQFEVGDPGFDPASIERNSVCYTGTHDNDTTVGWFSSKHNDTRTPEEAARIRDNVLRLTGGSAASVHLDLIRLAFASDAELAVAPMQDYLGLGSESRLNTPGTTRNNWRWRLLPGSLQPDLVDRIAEMTREASRNGTAS
jgi:4-alpha-glucanotransferase